MSNASTQAAAQAGSTAAGPLAGLKIVELGGIGAVPFGAMVLADLGATVLKITRPDANPIEPYKFEVVFRNRRSLELDLKKPGDVNTVLRLVDKADALLEGFRPGVTERLGLGPDVCMARNPRLVYARLTGWGQDGPLAARAGHDINYIALSGALHSIGRFGQPPTPPLNLVGDYAGGGLYMALGVVSAILESRSSGKGQVVDVAMLDGATQLMSKFYGMAASGRLNDERGTNLLDSGTYYYESYECADGKWMCVGPTEEHFHDELLSALGIEKPVKSPQRDRSVWPALREAIAGRFKTKTRDEWCAAFEGRDVCAAPVLSVREAPSHPHHIARGSFVEVDGVVQPAPAPRFSRTPTAMPRSADQMASTAETVMREWGLA
jgi:crotonobetainyl-CoA:carnitine CoA-transferase CaiB-like acyl-CoA transferase